MTILPKAVYRFIAILSKIPRAFSTELEQTVKNFAWKYKRAHIAITTSRKSAGGIMLPDFKLSCNATVIKHDTGPKPDFDQWTRRA